MRRRTFAALAATTLAFALPAQEVKEPPKPVEKPAPVKVADDFKREGDVDARKRKDPLEGKAPPAMQVAQWLNVEDQALTFDELKGKVIAIKFWGVW